MVLSGLRLRRRYGTVASLFFVVKERRPPSGPLKAFPLELPRRLSRRRVRARRSGPDSGLVFARSAFATQSTNSLGIYAVEARLTQSHAARLSRLGESRLTGLSLLCRGTTSLIIPNPPVASCVREPTAFLDASTPLRVP